MTRRNKTILTYCILIFLAAAIIASGRIINLIKGSLPEKDYATKLDELRADLMQAAKAGGKQQPAPSHKERASTTKSPKARPT